MTKTGTVIGTFDYTAPEQLDERPVDARTDVYALGCVLFQALTGRVPFPRDTLGATLFAHFEAPPPSVTALVPDVPRGARRRDRHRDGQGPAARYQSAGDLARAALAAVDRPSLARGVAGSRLARARRAGAGRRPAPRSPIASRCTPRSSELESGAFVGRADALDRLPRALRSARPPARARSCSLSGRAGDRQDAPGGRARPRGPRRAARPSSTAASDAESLVPYQPFVTAVQHYMAHRDTLELPARARPRS